MTGLWQDVRYGLRTFAKSPGFTAIAILTLALGIGATTTIFSVIDSVLLNPFPYKNADRLATVSTSWFDQNNMSRFPVAVFLDFKEQNHTFEDMIGLAYVPVRFQKHGTTEQVWGGWVTPDTFEVLGSKPLFGRPITSEDGKPGSPDVFVMSYEMWVKQFSKDLRFIGTTLNLNGAPRTLVAIMPPRFRFGECEIWMPLSMNRDTFITGFGLTPNEVRAVGHLKSRVSLQAAEADLEAIARRLEKTYPAYFQPQFKIEINTLTDDSVGHFKLTLFALLAAVAMLLLIACSNVANLLLARATVREKEIAIRAAIGATRSRLVRQLLVENFMLATASCIAGCILTYLGLKAVVAAVPPDTIPSEVAIELRSTALFFAVGVSFVTTLFCGLAPAVHAVRRDLRAGLAAAGKGTNEGSRQGGLRSGLVVAEVATSVVLLIGTGLMVRTLRALERVDIGFNPANVLYAELGLPEGRYDTANQKKVFFRKILGRFDAIPGVTASTVASSVPPYSWGWTEVEVPGKTHAGSWGTTFNMCSEGYFATLGRQLLSGRLLSQSDVDSARHAAVINQTLARAYFSTENPVGQRIRFSSFEMYSDWPRNAYFEIIGVIADAKNHGLQNPARPEAYFPYTITGIGHLRVMVRAAGNSSGILTSMRRQISMLDPDVAVSNLGSVDSYLKRSYFAETQFILNGLGTFTAIGLLLVIGGVFSVMAYTVSLRTHEIGIRMALGAQHDDVLRMVLKDGLVLIAGGIAVGVVVSLATTRFMASQIWGVSATDPWTFAVVATVILAAGLAACFFPARRASRIDPMVALRFE